MIHEFQQSDVELKECTHHLVVYIERQLLVELVRGYPSDWRAHYLYLVVNPLD